MDFPDTISDEDMQLRLKEWRLAGVEWAKSRTGKTLAIFCLDHNRSHCEWIYSQDAVNAWIRRSGIVGPCYGHFCKYGKHIRHVCLRLDKLG